MQVSGNNFVVTGGASGLGEATVRRIVAEGGNAVIVDLQDAKAEAIIAELGNAVRFAKTDVTNAEQCQAAIDLCISEFGSIQGVISCAGVGAAKKTVGKDGAHDLETFMFVININLVGTFNMVRLGAEAMAKNEPGDDGERGVLINTASVAAYDGQIGQVAYAASKGGIVGMTLPIARDLSRVGIRCCTIAPGIFETPLMMAAPEEVRQALGASVPFPSRLGKPDEFAQLAQQIVENTMLNGETIRLDGAIRMAPR